MNFLEASTFLNMGEGRYTGSFGEAWYQGRGAFGGLGVATLVRIFQQESPDPAHTIRSVTVHYCAPVTVGPLEVKVQVIRSGRYVTQMQARMLRGDQVFLVALAQLVRTPGGRVNINALTPPWAPPPEQVEPWPVLPMMPAFTQYFEYRPCLGGPMFSGGSDARLGGWCRLRDAGSADAPMMAALLDAWPPAYFVCTDSMHPSSTIDLTCHFLAELPLLEAQPEDYYLYEHHSPWMMDGLAEEYGTLWAKDGSPVARIRQMVVGFEPGAAG